MREICLKAAKENMEQALGFVEETLGELGCPVSATMKLMVVCDEILSNIVRYSGAKNMTVKVDKSDTFVVLKFIDGGSAYNPLLKADPDISLGAGERQVGGLGIFMVKNIADEVEYAYENGKNILTVCKKLGTGAV